jgi:DNA-binding transcriptional MerR regulator
MRFVHQTRTLGLTLGEIRDILQLQHVGSSPCDRVTQVIDGHLSAIDVSIANLLQLRQALRAAKTIADSRRPDHNGGGVCHIIERADAARDAVS